MIPSNVIGIVRDRVGIGMIARYFLSSYQSASGSLWGRTPADTREHRITQFELLTELTGFLILLVVLAIIAS